MMTVASAATAFWLAITPQIGIDTGSPGEYLTSYGGMAELNLGPIGIHLHGSITPYEEPEDIPNSYIDRTGIKHSNIGASAWYPVILQPVTFRLGVNYRMSRVDYYHFEGRTGLPFYGDDYLQYDHSLLIAGKVGLNNLIGGKGPSISIWSGFGPAYVTSEGRKWYWPSYPPDAPNQVTSLTGNAITIDGGFGIAAMQPLFPHFAITGTADFRINIAKVGGDDNIAETKTNQFTAYIGPTVYF